MTYSKKQLKQLAVNMTNRSKKGLAVGALVLTMAPMLVPVVANADTTNNAPITKQATANSVPKSLLDITHQKGGLRAINNDKNGMGKLIDEGSDKISFYQLNNDPAGVMVDGITIKNSGVQYSGVTSVVAMVAKGQFAYCLQNQKGNPVNQDVAWDANLSKYASELIQCTMVLGYPNVSSADLGVSGDNSGTRAYAVTQLAIWAAENGGKVENTNKQMVALSSLKEDSGGVIKGAKALYAKAQALEKAGGIDSLTKDTQAEEKAKAEKAMQADLAKDVAAKTASVTAQVDKDLASKETASKSTMTDYMKKQSAVAIKDALKDAQKDGDSVISQAMANFSAKDLQPTATITGTNTSQDNTFVFTPKATMPTFKVTSTDVHSIIKDKTTTLKLDKGYTGTVKTVASGKISVANTNNGKADDKIDTLTVKLSKAIPNGATITQDGQQIKVNQDNTIVVKNGVDLQVKVPKDAATDTNELSFSIIGQSVVSLADFLETATTNLTGDATVQASASDTATATETYTYQKGATVDVSGANVSKDPNNQNTGVFIMKTQATTGTDKVNTNQPVKVDKTKPVKATYSGTDKFAVKSSQTKERKAEAKAPLTWTKTAAKDTANTGTGSRSYGAIIATSLASVIALIGAFIKREQIKSLFNRSKHTGK